MRPSSPTPTAEQEFPYGWRYVQQGDTMIEVPLTLEDCLHPQEGDVLLKNTQHDRDCMYLAYVFRSRPLSPPFAFVSRDMGVEWGVAGIRHHSPDVGVFVGLSRDPRPTGLMELKAFGGKCELLVEVVSPSTRTNDVETKFDHYFRVGVPLYLIIDQKREGDPRTLHAYRRTPTRYEEIPLDPQGRFALPSLGLLLGLRDDQAVCFDLKTQEEIEDFTGLSQSRANEREQFHHFKEEAEQTIEEQDRELKEARQQADLALDKADRALQQAEDAQKEVGRVQKEADRALKAAHVERQKREDAEKQLVELQEKLRRLQSGDVVD